MRIKVRDQAALIKNGSLMTIAMLLCMLAVVLEKQYEDIYRVVKSCLASRV